MKNTNTNTNTTEKANTNSLELNGTTYIVESYFCAENSFQDIIESYAISKIEEDIRTELQKTK